MKTKNRVTAMSLDEIRQAWTEFKMNRTEHMKTTDERFLTVIEREAMIDRLLIEIDELKEQAE